LFFFNMIIANKSLIGILVYGRYLNCNAGQNLKRGKYNVLKRQKPKCIKHLGFEEIEFS